MAAYVAATFMRHPLEPIEVWPQAHCKITAENKEIGLNDFYFWERQKYGTAQSFGADTSHGLGDQPPGPSGEGAATGSSPVDWYWPR